MSKRFVSWAAVSSLPQAKKISLEDQLKTNREHIDQHEGQLVAELVVPGESRNIVLFEEAARRMEAYAQLRELIDRRAFDVLIYLDRSRLGRKASLSMAVVELCHEAGIATYETENPPANLEVDHSYDDALLGAIKSVGAQREIAKLKEKHRTGMIGRVRDGKFPIRIPWGWVAKYDEAGHEHIEIDEPVAALIREVFEIYLRQGLGMEAIADELNRRGYRTKMGKLWRLAHVQGLFRRVWRYAGFSEVHIGDEYVRAAGNWPTIISEDTARAVEVERKSRTKRARAIATTYLLSRLVVCSEHGSYLAVNTVRDEDGEIIIHYLRCKHCRRKHYIRFERVIERLRVAIQYIRQESNRTMILDGLERGDLHLVTEIGMLQKQLERCELAMRRADDAYVQQLMDTDRYRHQIERLKETRASIQAEIEQRENDLAAHRLDATRRERLEEISTLGEQMLIDPDTAKANAWLRRNFRVYVTGPTITDVLYL